MRITLYKPGTIPIPPQLYGGTERVIHWLGKALVESGHRVKLIASAQSHIPGVELHGGFIQFDMARKCLKYYEQVVTHDSLGEQRNWRPQHSRVLWQNSFCRGKIEFNLRA